MRLARVVLVIGLGLAAAPVQSQDVNFGEIMRGRALSPEEERERTERRDRLEDYDRLN